MDNKQAIKDKISQTTTQHYLALDGLRGVAALVVVWYHIFEAFATSPLDQNVNHGYLAVDFFFLLSGFVMSHAYDSQWSTMSFRDFVRRRIIRLHPMLVVSAILGGLMFYTQATPTQPLHLVPITMVVLSTLMNALLIPSLPSFEIRGYTEIFPLNGPTWSLFYEYIGSFLYGFVLRRLSTPLLALVVALSALGLGYEVFVHSPWGYAGAGWSFADGGFWGGLARLMTSFSLGLLFARFYKHRQIRSGFIIAALSLIAILVMPRIGGEKDMWLNASYELISILFIFPALLYLGASADTDRPLVKRIYSYLGKLSYPLYIIHYPFIYLYIAWVKTNELSFADSIYGALALFLGCIVLSSVLMKYYDEPVRRYLTKRCGTKK